MPSALRARGEGYGEGNDRSCLGLFELQLSADLVAVFEQRRQRASDRVEGEDGQGQHETGQHGVVGRLVEELLAGSEHLTPARGRRRDADAEEGKRGLEEFGSTVQNML